MTIESVFVFAGMVSIMVVSPGPNLFLIVKNVPLLGIKTGLFNTLGIVSAIIIHGTLASLGLSSIIVASARLFVLIKILGALYLCFLGIQTILISCKEGPKTISPKLIRTNKKPWIKAYVEGLVINLLNPKTALFYLAIFSQFIQMESAIFDSLFLILIHASIAFAWYFLVAAGLRKGKNVIFYRTASSTYFQKVSGIVFIYSGLRLAMSQE